MIETNNQELNAAAEKQHVINYTEAKKKDSLNLKKENVSSFSGVHKQSVNILTSGSYFRSEDKIHITKLSSQTFFNPKENKDALKSKENLVKITTELSKNRESEFSEFIKHPESIVEDCVHIISKNFGKKGFCVRNSYAMAKILLSESDELPKILKDLFSKDSVQPYVEYEHVLKEKLVKSSGEYDKFVQDFDFSSENLEIAVNELFDSLLNQPKNSILIAENEEHNYLFVINKNKQVFMVDADHGFIAEINYINIPELIRDKPGFFDDNEGRTLTISFLGNLNPAWIGEMSSMTDKNISNDVIRPSKS